MTNPTSEPRVPAQPQADMYAVAELALFRPFNRDSYRAAFGVQPPPYDPGRLIKNWFDSTADTSHDSNVALYRILGQDTRGLAVLRQMVIPAAEAATVNLPGAVEYPVYVIPPSKATRTGAVLNPIYLSLEADARSLMHDAGGQDLKDEGADQVFPTFYPPDEPRRVWVFQFKGYPVNVGMALYAKNARVGAPGQWDFSGSTPTWTPAPAGPTGLDDHRTPRDMPLRDLLANERFEAGLMQEVSVIRTDLRPKVQGAADGFTADDRSTLLGILQKVSKLAG